MRKTFISAVGGVALFAGAAVAESIPEKLMNDLQADLDLTKAQAAGIVGNLARETGNFRYIVELNPVVKGSRGGIGYVQWTGPRHDALLAWAEEGADFSDYEVNYGYMLYELQGEFNRALTKLRQTETVAEATVAIMENYLMPHRDYLHLDERISYAKAYVNGDFDGAGCQKWHHLEVNGRIQVVATCAEILAMNEQLDDEMVQAVEPEAVRPYFVSQAQSDLITYESIASTADIPPHISSEFYRFQTMVASITGCTVDPFAPTVCQESLLDQIRQEVETSEASQGCEARSRSDAPGFCL